MIIRTSRTINYNKDYNVARVVDYIVKMLIRTFRTVDYIVKDRKVAYIVKDYSVVE